MDRKVYHLDRNAFRQLRKFCWERSYRHKPLQYILGTQPFCGLSIRVKPPILIPRPETEQWTAELIWQLKAHLQETRKPVRILDLCSGSGCISLAIAYQLGRFIERANIADVGVYIEGVDINPLATQLAQMNAKHLCNDLKNVKVHFRTGDLFGKEFAEHYHSNRFDLIVSNPPYVLPEEYERDLTRDVKLWEDHRALVGVDENFDGLLYYRRILALAPLLLRNDEDKSTEERRFEEVVDIPYRDPDKQPLLDAKSFKTPRLIMEYGGSHQTDGLLRLMHGYQWKQVWRDLFGRERAIVA